MSLSSATHMNLVDLQKTLAPDGTVMEVAQVLNQMNEGIMSSINFIEGNMENGNQHSFQTSLPGTSLGALNKGVAATKGNTAQSTDTCAHIESLSEIEAKILAKSPNPALTRQQRDITHIEAMHQDFLYYWWYGNSEVEPLAFNGLTKRYNNPAANNGDNIIDGSAGIDVSGRTDLESIWIMSTGPTTISGIIPKRTTPGLITEDWGKQQLPDDGSNTNSRVWVYQTYFCMNMGISVMDWRYAVRICNLPLDLIVPDAGTGPNLPFIIKEAMERLWKKDGARIYMSRKMRVRLGQQIASGVDSSTLTTEQVGGIAADKVTMFDGTPLFRTDSLKYSTVKPTEAQANPSVFYTGEPAVTFA